MSEIAKETCSNVIDLLVFTLFGSEAATEVTLPGLKQPFCFCCDGIVRDICCCF